jgi:hypothetical protein
MDPRIRIRIHTKMSGSSTLIKIKPFYLYLGLKVNVELRDMFLDQRVHLGRGEEAM